MKITRFGSVGETTRCGRKMVAIVDLLAPAFQRKLC